MVSYLVEIHSLNPVSADSVMVQMVPHRFSVMGDHLDQKINPKSKFAFIVGDRALQSTPGNRKIVGLICFRGYKGVIMHAYSKYGIFKSTIVASSPDYEQTKLAKRCL